MMILRSLSNWLTNGQLRLVCLSIGIGLLPVLGHAQFSGGDGRGDVQFTFTPPSFVGIGSLTKPTTDPLRAWPIPASEELQLDRVVTATIVDMAGHLVGSIARANVVDMGSLPYGAYLLRTDQGEVLRFIRE